MQRINKKKQRMTAGASESGSVQFSSLDPKRQGSGNKRKRSTGERGGRGGGKGRVYVSGVGWMGEMGLARTRLKQTPPSRVHWYQRGSKESTWKNKVENREGKGMDGQRARCSEKQGQ